MKGNEAEILLRDMQEYRELTNRVKAIYGDQMTLKDMVERFGGRMKKHIEWDKVSCCENCGIDDYFLIDIDGVFCKRIRLCKKCLKELAGVIDRILKEDGE